MTELVDAYIAQKHGLGYKIEIEGKTLRRFAAYAESKGYDGSLNIAITMDWISSFENASGWYEARLYETVRTFSRYACISDENSVLLPKGPGTCHGRTTPYIYEDIEVALLMDSLAAIYSPDGLRANSASMMCGLMRSCGLRPSEAIRLRPTDYDSEHAIITIEATKFGRSRRVPLSASAAARIESHLSRSSVRKDGPMFPRTGGLAFDTRALDYAWQITRSILLPVGASTWNRRPPRPYDLRHTFATKTLERWLEEGRDIDVMMPYLSTYMGHSKIADTYWYLSATETLLEKASSLFSSYASVGEWHE